MAFRTSARSLAACGDSPRDVAVRLERNEWNGTVEPRLVLRALCEPRAGTFGVLDDALGVSEHLDLQLARPIPAARLVAARQACDRRGEGVAGVLGDLLASGDDVLIACGEPRRWKRGLDATLAGLRAGARRSFPGTCSSCFPRWRRPIRTSSPSIRRRPPSPSGLRRVCPAPGFAHCGWGPGEEAVARTAIEARLDPRAGVARVYRALREPAMTALGDLDALLDPIASRADSAFALRVLLDLSLVQIEQGTVRLLESRPTQLEASPAYREHVARLQAATAALGGDAAPIAA